MSALVNTNRNDLTTYNRFELISLWCCQMFQFLIHIIRDMRKIVNLNSQKKSICLLLWRNQSKKWKKKNISKCSLSCYLHKLQFQFKEEIQEIFFQMNKRVVFVYRIEWLCSRKIWILFDIIVMIYAKYAAIL